MVSIPDPLPARRGVASSSGDAAAVTRSGVLDFVRTPYAVRCNVVKVWRKLPEGLWTVLALPSDRLRSIRCERRSMVGVALMALALATVFTSVELRHDVGGLERCYPLLGKSMAITPDVPLGPGWHFVFGRTLGLAWWTLVPPLSGWALVRLVWIPRLVSGRPTHQATVTFARHLGGVYFYVYLMIVMGSSLMPALVMISPAGTETFRWYLWCFLFGESFFVPTVMWIRLIVNDSAGEIFGRSRHVVMGLFVAMFVMAPIWGMTRFLD